MDLHVYALGVSPGGVEHLAVGVDFVLIELVYYLHFPDFSVGRIWGI